MIATGGLSSEMEEHKLHEFGVFWANYGKKHPIWKKNIDAFLSKLAYWRVGNCVKNWFRETGFACKSTYNVGKSIPPLGQQKTHLASLKS